VGWLALASSVSGAEPTRVTPITGRLKCGVNYYAWPLSTDTPPIQGGTGLIEITSEPQGLYTSGQMTQHQGDDTHTLGEDLCTFDLDHGTYVLNADGTTTSTIVWKLRPGGDAKCGAFVTGEKYLGLTEGARQYRGFKTTSTSYVLKNGKIGWSGASPLGFAIGLCELEK